MRPDHDTGRSGTARLRAAVRRLGLIVCLIQTGPSWVTLATLASQCIRMIYRAICFICLISLVTSPICVAAGQRLPDGWPADATPPPHAKIVESNVQRLTQSIAFELPAPEDEALADMAEHLQQRGWITGPIDHASRPGRIDGSSRDGRRITVLTDGTLHGSTAVLLTIYQPGEAF